VPALAAGKLQCKKQLHMHLRRVQAICSARGSVVCTCAGWRLPQPKLSGLSAFVYK
jgi:hypothetical protein